MKIRIVKGIEDWKSEVPNEDCTAVRVFIGGTYFTLQEYSPEFLAITAERTITTRATESRTKLLVGETKG